MSKYEPLSVHLRGHPGQEWRASFTEIEDVLGFPLPKGARSGRAWWTNDLAKPHSRAWAAQGWQAHEVDPAQGLVTFRRGEISPAAVEAAAGLKPIGELSGVQPLQAADHAQPAVGEPAAPRPEQGPGGKAAAPMRVQAPVSKEVQPPAMKEAAEAASKKMHATRMVGMAALVTGAAAVIAGVGAVAVRGLIRRK